MIVDKFLAEFNRFLVQPRIREVIKEKMVQTIVEKDKIVKVPVQTADDERRGLASAVLIDKLVMELRRMKQSNPNSQYKIDPELVMIFGNQLDPISSKFSNNVNELLDEYSKTIFARFNMYGTWTNDHQRMLKEFIEERFTLAHNLKKATKDAIKYKELSAGYM